MITEIIVLFFWGLASFWLGAYLGDKLATEKIMKELEDKK